MPGLGQIALNSAPIFGGAMLAIAAGQFKGPDFRALIRQDMDLLDRLPADATKRRAKRCCLAVAPGSRRYRSAPRRPRMSEVAALPAPRRRRCPGDADGRRCMVCASYADTHHRKDAQRCNQARSIQ